MSCVRPGFSFVTVLFCFSPGSLAFGPGVSTVPKWSLDHGSRIRVYIARSPAASHRIEFTSGSFKSPSHYGLAVRFQLLSTDGFRRRSYFPLQATLTLAWRGLPPRCVVVFAVALCRSYGACGSG